MTKSLKAFYKEEYETTSLSIEQLCEKYSIQIEELGDISDWIKVDVTPPAVLSVEAPLISTPIEKLPEQDELLKSDILDFKKKTVKECLARLRMAQTLETKELKDLVTVVDIVDKSLRSTKEGQNVNVLIQNIINKYGDDV